MTLAFSLYVHIYTYDRSIFQLGDWIGPLYATFRMEICISGLVDIPTAKNFQATSIPFAYTLKVFWIIHVFW
jgi:hypothetical protein